MPELWDCTRAHLGEGPLWHPEKRHLFWFDITGKTMHARREKGALRWRFSQMISAAGWVDTDTLLIASDTALSTFDLINGSIKELCPLEADIPGNRSNDGRADPLGGFWIGTMDLSGAKGKGAIYRYFKGELRRLFPGISVPNAICFAPNGKLAYFTDTPTQKILCQALDKDGWPVGQPQIFVDLSAQNAFPDGATMDVEGCLWVAIWDGARLLRIAPNGEVVQTIQMPTARPTCPAFGGLQYKSLFVTTARIGQTDPAAGQTFRVDVDVPGRAEPRVRL